MAALDLLTAAARPTAVRRLDVEQSFGGSVPDLVEDDPGFLNKPATVDGLPERAPITPLEIVGTLIHDIEKLTKGKRGEPFEHDGRAGHRPPSSRVKPGVAELLDQEVQVSVHDSCCGRRVFERQHNGIDVCPPPCLEHHGAIRSGSPRSEDVKATLSDECRV